MAKHRMQECNRSCERNRYTMIMALSVVFLGTSAFAVPSLRALATHPDISVTRVITQPDRPAGRKKLLTQPPVKIEALRWNIPVLQPEKIDTCSTAELAPERPAFLVVVSYGQILSDRLLAVPTIAAINVHASLLPLLRGASPIQHAILEGMHETGVTVQQMVRELDAGPILAQVTVPLSPDTTATALHDVLAERGAALLLSTIVQPLKPRPQDASAATFCRKLCKEDGIADPATMDAATIERMIRALSPWPGVTIRGTKILHASLSPTAESMPVACHNGTTLYVTRVQPQSGAPMSGAAFLRGHTL